MLDPLPRVLRLVLAAAVALAATAPHAAALPAPEPLAQLDLARYLGRWYVIAQLPSDDAVASYFEYGRRDDGRIEGRYVARDDFDRAPATVKLTVHPDPARPARWDVRQGWFRSEERRVLYVSADYRHAIVGDTDREALWLLAREPVIAEWIYAGLLARVALQGYDVSRIRRVPQRRSGKGE